jgi:hypothetical protein
LGWTLSEKNAREADVGPLQAGDHRIHHAPLPRPVAALERSAAIHVHRDTALPNEHGPLADGAVRSLRDGTDLCGEVVSRTLLPPVERLDRVNTLSRTSQHIAAQMI